MAKGLIGIGREQKRQALAGLTRSAELEAQQDIANMQLKAQKTAAQMNVAGTAGGITAASLLAKRAASKGIETALAQRIAQRQVAAGVAQTGAAVTQASQAAIAAETTAAAGGAAAGGGAGSALLAAAPWAALIIGGGYLLKKLFD